MLQSSTLYLLADWDKHYFYFTSGKAQFKVYKVSKNQYELCAKAVV